MLALLMRVPLRTWLTIGAVLALVLGGLWALDSYGDRREDEGRAAVQAEWNAEREVMERAAAQAEDENRRLEQALAARTQEAQRARENERAATARAAADLRAHERMRDAELAAYAAGGGGAADDSIPACRGRAAELASTVGEALSAHAECTSTAANLAADLRAVLAAWPAVKADHAEEARPEAHRTD